MLSFVLSFVLSFNSRAREGRDAACVLPVPQAMSFNSRAREGRDRDRSHGLNPPFCFNSRAREGRDSVMVFSFHVVNVSTHAPARGATTRNKDELRAALKFQLTRPRGARQLWTRAEMPRSKFQLTRPRGARRCTACARLQPRQVSTHAPARGATSNRYITAAKVAFQLTRPRGARPMAGTTEAFCMRFNSRAREGRDFSTPQQQQQILSFNSRAREGRDQ